MTRRLCTLVMLVGLVALSLVGPAAAGTSHAGNAGTMARSGSTGTIVYVCGDNLCRVDPATGKTSALTTDGTAESAYASPSLSKTGSVLAFIHADGVFSGPLGGPYAQVATSDDQLENTAVSPDGKLVDYGYSYYECVYTAGLCFYTQTYHFRSTLGGSEGDGSDVTFLDASGSVVLDGLNVNASDNYFGCIRLDPSASSSDCDRTLSDPGVDVMVPAATADGGVVATIAGDLESASGLGIILWDPATGAETKSVLSQGVALGGLSFSPDGRNLTYSGTAGGIWTIPAAGGQPTRLVDGTQPTWGGSATTDVLPHKRLHVKLGTLRKSHATVVITCPWTCKISVKLQVSKQVRMHLGLSRGRVAVGTVKAKAGKKKVRLTVTHKTAKRLKHGFPAVLRVKVTPVHVAGAKPIHDSAMVTVK